jgi:hypothetical protein
MVIKNKLVDGRGRGHLVRVSSRGQLITAPLDFSDTYTQEVNATATAFNFIGPVTGKQFVITDILLYANKDVGVNDASVQIYEATSASSTTESKTILDIEMVKQTSRDITGLNLLTSEGVWLNIKTDDATIFATLMGYYVDA